MNYLNLPANHQEQYAKIIEDTEEIIKNFREISELMITRLEKTESSMFTLSKKVIRERNESLNLSAELNNGQTNSL